MRAGSASTRGPDGTFDLFDEDLPPHTAPTPRGAYALLWDRIHGRGAWAENPWVAALTFTVERRNIDAPATEAADA